MKAFRKDFFREITKNKGRFLSVFFIVLLGAAFFSGIRSAEGDMKASADRYYDEVHYMDLKVLGTLGLTDDDLNDIAKVDGVKTVSGGHTLEVLHDIGESEQVVKLIALTDGINEPDIKEGRMPKNTKEILVDTHFLTSSGCKIGDTVTFQSGTEDPLSDSLTGDTFTIVGSATLPYYMDLNRGTGSIGNGSINSFALLLPEAFTSDLYTEIYVQADGSQELASYSDAYDDLVKKVQTRIEDLEDAACSRRYTTVVSDGQKDIADARQKVSDAEQELSDAKEKLEDGEQQIADAKTTLQEKEQELLDGEQTLQEKEQELIDGRQTIVEKEQTLSDARQTLAQKTQELQSGKAQLEQKASELANGKALLQEKAKELENSKALLSSKENELNQGKAEIAAKTQELSDAKTSLAQKQETLEQSKAALAEQETSLNAAKTQLDTAKEELQSNQEKTAAARNAYESQKALYEEKKAQVQTAREQLSVLEEEQIPALQDALSQMDAQILALSDQLAGLDPSDASYAALQEQINTLETQKETQSQLLSEMEQQKTALQQNIDAFDAVSAETEQQLSDTDAQLTAAETQLSKGAEELSQKEMEWQTGYEQLSAAKTQIADGEQQLQDALEQIHSGEAQIAAYQTQISSGEAQLADAKSQIVDGEQQIEANKKNLDDGESQIAAARQTLADGEAQIADASAQLSDGEAQIAAAKQTLSDGEAQIADAKAELEDGKAQLSDAKIELADKEQELKDGRADYEEAKAKAEPELADARQKISDGEQTLKDLKMPTWYVWGRDKITSTESFGQDAGRISNIGKFFPVIFFLVAALVSLTTMTRMIEEQRQQIGTLKALGYSDGTIALKYFAYAMLSTVTGAFAGMLVGEKILPWVIMNAYGMLYTGLPYYLTPLNWEQGGLAILASAACTGVATIAACYRELAARPAELMRPEAPKNGKRIFLERIGFLWKHLNFTQKSTVRNLVRYKKRFFMTVIGIGGCMGLILVGFGLQDSITAIAKNQFVSLFTYQANAVLNADVPEEEKETFQADLASYDGIDQLLEMYCQNIELQTDKKTVDAVLEVPKELTHFSDFFAFRDRVSGETYDFPTDGAAISEKTATMLGVKPGDTVQLKKGDTIVTVKISIVVENYVRHYLYLTPELYESLFEETPDYNQLLLKYQDTSASYEEALGQKIMTYDSVAAISFTSDLIDQIDNMLRSLDIVIVVLIVSAGLLAFVVLYNLNNINITERQRELATLKVLGFYDGEVASYVYRENMVLTLFGIIAGMGIGALLHQHVIQTVEVDLMMFGRNIFPRSYCYSALITLAFALFVNFMMFYRLRKIDMIESLKSVE